MKNRKLALILSLIYSGLGQVYKGQVLKGVDFILIYTMAIIAALSRSPWLHRIGLSVLPAMWIAGMLDAYLLVTRKKQWLFVVLPCALILLLMFSIQTLSGVEDPSEIPPQSVRTPSMEESTEDIPLPSSDDLQDEETQPELTEFFSIQVAAFKYTSLNEAEQLRDEFQSKGYPARIELPLSTDDEWYRVLIGKFATEQEANSLADQLKKQEAISYMIVHRANR